MRAPGGRRGHAAGMGRGAFYSNRRALVEAVLRRAYVGDWPARAWAALPRATDVRVRHERLPLLGPTHAPLRIGFVSDLHIGPTTPDALLTRAFDLLAAAKPDVLALGGDYVFLEATEAKARRLAALVSGVGAPLAVAVLGNHDLWTDHSVLEDALHGVGVRVLVNDAVALGGEHRGVAVVGLDDPWTGAPDIERALRAADGADVLLAISHSPDAVPLLAHASVRLVLAGHTHGGHVALPGSRPLVVPGTHGRRYPHGRHRLPDGAVLLVSRGVGGIEVPVRLFAPPDVLVVDLVGSP